MINLIYKCDVCDKVFCLKRILQKHSGEHTSVGKIFTWEICNQGFSRKQNLQTHIRTHPGDFKPFKE